MLSANEGKVIEERVEACRNGQTRAYAAIVRELQPRLLAFLYRMTQNREWAEDLGQEAFLRAWRNLGKFDRRKAKFVTWLFTLARNLCLDEMRKKRVACSTLDEESLSTPASDPKPDRVAHEKELEMRIAGAVSELEPIHREVFILREYEEMSLNEIAEVTGCRVGTVKSRLHRARTQLQELLAPYLNVATE